MILKRKALLAKLMFFAFVINLNLLFAKDLIDLAEKGTKITSSPFSVLKEGSYGTNDGSLLVIKQYINTGDMEAFGSAKIRLLEYNTGKSINYTITKDEKWQYNENTYILLHDCFKVKESIFNPVNMALISIINENDTIFKGWIFSKNFALSLPKIDGYFLHLTECLMSDIKNKKVSENSVSCSIKQLD